MSRRAVNETFCLARARPATHGAIAPAGAYRMDGQF